MDADEHDSYVAAVSHLPLVLASALFSTAFGSAAWPELAQLASSGFRDTTRLASSSPEMAHDIMATNRENVLHWLDRFSEELARYRNVVAQGGDDELLDAFRRAALERDNFMINGAPARESAAEPAERMSISDMLLGTKIAGAMRKQQETLRQMEEKQKDPRR
jgi:prephenate dehydrogenase